MEASLERIGTQIDRDLDQHIANIQSLIRQPSMSTSGGLGIREMAVRLQKAFAELGCQDTALFDTSGNPVVFGHYDTGASKTLIVYLMYDTEAVLPEEEWISPPLEANLVELPPFGRCIIGRGAVNSKGPLQAFLNTVAAIHAAGEALPVNLKFVAEGEEELGSIHVADVLQDHGASLQADALFFPAAGQQANGHTTLTLGSRTAIIFELEVNGERWGRGPSKFEIHAGSRSLVDCPVSHLLEALNCLIADNGNRILVEGFYEDVVPPNEEEEELLDRLAARWDEEAYRARLGVKAFIDGLAGRAALKRLIFEPAFNIRGIYGGDSRTGDVNVSKAIIPHRAVCKVGLSLVPDQNKVDIVEKIRAHLDRNGFADVAMRVRPDYLRDPGAWGQVSVHDDIVVAMLHTYARYGIDPEIWPRSPGGWPGYLFQHYLGIPFLSGGAGHGGGAHSSNEYLVVDGHDTVRGLADLEKSYAHMLYEYASL
ncbi:MAG TPA: twin-arginine translocation pathway signal protein [Chloroflexi bacterium]|nr:twin-arginine translocation pathway signal protein [Chloroflexota bacterium]